MIERIQPTLSLLDQGFGLYRRHFGRFVLITAIWFVPVAILIGLGIVFSSQIDEVLGVVLVVLGALVFFVLMLYLVTALSRAAGAALENQPLQLGAILRFEPLRMVGMVVFSIAYLILAQFASTAIGFICICPAYIFGFGMVGVFAAAGGEMFGIGGIVLVALLFAVIYAASLFISGAVYGGLIYGLQPWAQDKASFGVALQRGFELMFYRFWRNLVTWGLSALILTAVGLAVTITIGTVLPLPLAWAFGGETPVVQAITAAIWLVGFVLVLPPLPIWMAMLYRRNRAAREGYDLQVMVDRWWNEHFNQVQNA